MSCACCARRWQPTPAALPRVQVVETYAKELGLGGPTSKQASAITAARGANKVAALAAAARTAQFMDRYHADLATRGSRLQQLQDRWLRQQRSQPGPGGAGGGGPAAAAAAAAALSPEQRDLAQAVQGFKALGWEDEAAAGWWLVCTCVPRRPRRRLHAGSQPCSAFGRRCLTPLRWCA
jgi:hypothetical protein